MTNSIQCENIVKKYKDFLLKSVSLTIKPGYLTGLIGVNGSGKTTLINIIAGLDTDFEGKVNINGIDIKKNTSEAKQEIGLISEKLSFFMDKTAYEN
ncbi:MAG: ATP-binding cassette domain-containing protein [Clostridium sp.]|nr:ATP-binding cassette domain-containing protein [Clostridium sp.]